MPDLLTAVSRLTLGPIVIVHALPWVALAALFILYRRGYRAARRD